MIRVIHLVFLFCGISFVGLSQKINVVNGFKAIEERNYGLAINAFSSAKEYEQSIAFYGKAILYSVSIELYDIDSALIYLSKSIKTFSQCSLKLSNKKLVAYQACGWILDTLLKKQEVLQNKKFVLLKDKSDVIGLSELSKVSTTNYLRERIIECRDSIWLNQCIDSSFSCILGLAVISPKSKFEAEIKEQLDQSSFTLWVKHGTEDELSTFILYHPYSAYKRMAEDNLYSIFIEGNDTNEFKRFITSYPTNQNIDRVWRIFYQLSSGNYDSKKMQSFIDRYPEYPFAEAVRQELSLFGKELFPMVSLTGQYGYMDQDGIEVIAPKFDWVGEFNEGLAIAMKDDKYGVIDKQGRTHLPFEYEFITDFHNGNAIFQKNENYGIINRAGLIIVENKYSDLDWAFGDLLVYEKEGFYGLMMLDGTVLSEPRYRSFRPISELLAVVEIAEGVGVINASMMEVIPARFDEVLYIDGLFYVDKEGKKGVYDGFGKCLLSVEFDEIGARSEGYRIVRKGQKYSYVNEINWKVSLTWLDVYPNVMRLGAMSNGQFLIQKKAKNYIMDTTGKTFKLFNLDRINTFSNVISGVKIKNGKIGFFNRTGTELSPFIYDYVELMKNGLYLVKNKDKLGVFSKGAEPLIDCQYDDISVWTENHLLVESGTKKGIFTITGKLIVPIEYDLIKKYNETFWVLTKENEQVYFNPMNEHWIKKKQ